MTAAWCEGSWWWQGNHVGFFGLCVLRERGEACRNTKIEAISTHMPVYLQGNFAKSIVVSWIVGEAGKQSHFSRVVVLRDQCPEGGWGLYDEQIPICSQWPPLLYSSYCGDPSSGVCLGPTDLLPTNTTWQNWWDVTSDMRVQKGFIFLVLFSCYLSYGSHSHAWACLWEAH